MHVWRSIPSHAETPIALTIGNFDGVHLGHQAMLTRLKNAASQLGLPACVMTFEPHPREFFSPDQAPTRLTSLREKLELLDKSGIDGVIVYRFNFDFAKINPETFITRILVKGFSTPWILVGDDIRFGARRAGEFSMLNDFSIKHHFEAEEMPSFAVNDQRVSSTSVREALTCGDLNHARQLLGRPYSISGRVMNGDKLGKKLGFPTANIQLKHNKPPVSGIFVVIVHGAVKSSPTEIVQGVASLGVRPTVHKNGKPVLEVHLFDFNQEIYGRHLRVDFLHKLRDEETYSDLETLTQQIAKDVENAKSYFLTSNVNQ